MPNDIRISETWYYNLKRKRLIRRLGHKAAIALIDLWIYASQHRPDGNFEGMSDESIAEAAQYDGKSDALVRTLHELTFIEGESGNYRLHDWEEHQPFICNAEARSKAASKAANVRWREIKGVRGVCEPDAERIQDASETHTERMPDAMPPPTSPPTSHKNPPTDGEYVRVWIDLYRDLREEPKYKATGREINELKKIWNHLDCKPDDFKLVCTNYLESDYVKMPSAKKLYDSGIESYRNSSKKGETGLTFKDEGAFAPDYKPY